MAEHQVGNPDRRKLVSIDEIVDILSHRPVATTRERGWNGVTVDLYHPLNECSEKYPALDHHMISYCPWGHGRLVQGRGGKTFEGAILPGFSLLMPAGHDSIWEGNPAPSARLRIPASLMATAADQVGYRSTSQVELRNVFEARDPIVSRVAQILLEELERPAHPAQALIVDQASALLATHLLRSYNGFDVLERLDLPSLGAVEITRLIAFIEDNIDRTIALAELAALVNVDRFHFTRLFKRATGVTASSFVEQRRIQRAQSLILETDIPLSQIALMVGFADQSHFTRRFHRHVGSTPGAFARSRGRRRPSRRS